MQRLPYDGALNEPKDLRQIMALKHREFVLAERDKTLGLSHIPEHNMGIFFSKFDEELRSSLQKL